MKRAYSETQAFARAIVAAERRQRTSRVPRSLLGGAVALLALVLALPYLGVPFGDGSTQVAGLDFDALSPAELSELAPAAGGEGSSMIERWLRALLD